MSIFRFLKIKIKNIFIKEKQTHNLDVDNINGIENSVKEFDHLFYIEKILLSPTNFQSHLDLSIAAFEEGLYYLAYSELKTAEFLGGDSSIINDLKEKFLSSIEEPLDMDHNQYYRYMTLKNEILNNADSEDFSILDVGGGFGQLASFLPNAKYCLVEPTVNGLSGLELPFDNKSFDYVVSCHVLEHIPENNRYDFLDQLMLKAKKGVILLNPFHLNKISSEERLETVIDITNADWAIEHLACGFPKVEHIKKYASERNLDLQIQATGSIATTTAMVFVSYFANRLNDKESLRKINRLYNESYSKVVNSEDAPTAYLVYLSVK